MQIAPGLVELAYGDWQGKTLKQLGRLKLWKVVQEKPIRDALPARVKALSRCRHRAVAEIDRIAAAHEEGDLVACFSHGDIIRLLVAITWVCRWICSSAWLPARLRSACIHINKKGRPHGAARKPGAGF